MAAGDFAQIRKLLQGARRAVLAVHERPDGDALGAMLALAEHLRSQGKQVITFSRDPIPESFTFLPGSERVVRQAPVLADTDVVVLLDCGDVERTNLSFEQRRDGQPTVVNIDHHPTRTLFRGKDIVDVNHIDTRASSTCELIYEYLLATEAPITKPIATCLLTGICTDTGSFQNLATTDTCLAAAAKLLIYGANLPKIIEATYKNKSVGVLKLWGRVLMRLKKDEVTGIVTTVVRQQDLDDCGVDQTAAEGVSNFLNGLGEARVTLVLKEEPDGIIRGSYRTTKSDVDVSALAAAYGGGGHAKAAGFTVKGQLEETPTGWRVITEGQGYRVQHTHARAKPAH